MGEIRLNAVTASDMKTIKRMETQCNSSLCDCIQCGKCTAGCPMAEFMDLAPRQVIRHLQLGLLDPVLQARSPWLCASCQVCSARCPNSVKIFELMEAVQQEAASRGIAPVRTANLFTRGFMMPVYWFGRSHEMLMTAFYNLSSGRLLQNFSYLPKMIRGRKLKIFHQGVRDKKAVRKIINNCRAEATKK